MRASLSRPILFLIAPVVAALLLLQSSAPAAAATHPGSDPAEITQVGSLVFFAATTAAHGRELWVTDGTRAGTHEVADINPTAGVGSNPDQLTAMGSNVFFFADNGAGGALWRSDGTTAGTKRLGGGAGAGLTNVDGTLFFYVARYSDYALWKSDGTARGTRRVAIMGSIDGPVAALGGYYYFFSGPYSLWKSDGTTAGTSVVAQIAGGGDGYDGPVEDEMVVAGNLVYFLMQDMAFPCRGPADLWQSDGTPAGTHRVYVFDPSEDIDYVDYGLTSLGSELYFGAVDKDGNNVLWKTNGTESGTRIVKRIDPSRDCGTTTMTAVGSRLFFFYGNYGGLWRTRGTARTTVEVYPIDLPGCAMYTPEPYCSHDGTPVAAGSRLFFPAYAKGSGYELWVSDGTTAGTYQIKNIVYGGSSSYPSDLAAAGSLVYFSARDVYHGRELWVSDGTARGTHMVMDINPG